MNNLSGLRPVGVAVLLKSYEPERKGALIEIPDQVKGRMVMVDHRAIVVEVGVNAWHDEPSPRCAAGDRVLVTKFAGFFATGPADGRQYRIVNDRDIFTVITHEEGV